MIKAIVTARVEKLLNELEEIAEREASNIVDAQNELSPIKKAVLTTIPPNDLKRVLSIRAQINFLNMIFTKE